MKKTGMPRYQQVAIEIAERIVDNRYPVGQKIRARSTLASTFNVSPETARKAINVLVDLDIMEVKHGSGVFVTSKENAVEFLDRYQNVQSVQELQSDLQSSITKQHAELNHFSELLEQMMTQSKRVNRLSPFLPSKITLTAESDHVNQTVMDLNIWHATGATIIGIQREGELQLSPGPYAKVLEKDEIFFIGNEEAIQRMHHFFQPVAESFEITTQSKEPNS